MSRRRWHAADKGEGVSVRSSWSVATELLSEAFSDDANASDDSLLSFELTSGEKLSDCDVMACHDRTGEFTSVLRTMQSRQLNGVAPHMSAAVPNSSQVVAARNPALRQHAEFMKIAKLIGKDIANTYTKLEKLALLAKRKSLFDDRPAEVQELTHIIKQDMNSLNKQILQLQQLGRGSSTASAASRHVNSFSTNIVVALQSRLANMSTDFKRLLELRTENMRSQKSRRDQFTRSSLASSGGGAGAANSLPPSALVGHRQGSVLLADEAAAVSAASHVVLDMDGVRERNSPASQQGPNQQQQHLIMLQEEDEYYQARSDTMKNIESTIVELGAIFQQLAHMVKEQEEVVQRIDSNVEDASMNVEAAHSEILKYFQSVSNNRWLMLKVFGVLIFFFLIFVLFLT